MEDKKSSRLADALGLSRATVSRALRHCSGVDTETRQRILEHCPVTPTDGISLDLYVILPDVPHFFWGEMQKTVFLGGQEITAARKYNVYTKLGDDDTVLTYLKEAEEKNARILLLSARMTPTVKATVARLARERQIFLLSEFCDIPHTFYFGADPFAEGETLGRLWCQRTPHRPLRILSAEWQENARLRTKGFLSICRAAGRSEDVSILPLPEETLEIPRLIPSKVAALLSGAQAFPRGFDLYLPTGLPNLALILRKAGISRETRILSHDPEPDALSLPFEALYLCQDARGQGLAALKAARSFLSGGNCPDRKFTHLPSRLECISGTGKEDKKEEKKGRS